MPGLLDQPPSAHLDFFAQLLGAGRGAGVVLPATPCGNRALAACRSCWSSASMRARARSRPDRCEIAAAIRRRRLSAPEIRRIRTCRRDAMTPRMPSRSASSARSRSARRVGSDAGRRVAQHDRMTPARDGAPGSGAPACWPRLRRRSCRRLEVEVVEHASRSVTASSLLNCARTFLGQAGAALVVAQARRNCAARPGVTPSQLSSVPPISCSSTTTGRDHRRAGNEAYSVGGHPRQGDILPGSPLD